MCWVRSPTWGAGGALAGPHWAPRKLSLQRQTHLTSYSKFPTCEQVPFQECVCTSTQWLCSFVTVIGLSYSLHKYTGHIYIHYTVREILQARILDWVAIPFSRGSSQLRDRMQVSCIAGRFFTS